MFVSYSECYDLMHEILELNKKDTPDPKENNAMIDNITRRLRDLDNKELVIIDTIVNKMNPGKGSFKALSI